MRAPRYFLTSGLRNNSKEIQEIERKNIGFVTIGNSDVNQIQYRDPLVKLTPDFQCNCDCDRSKPIKKESFDEQFITTTDNPNTNFNKSSEFQSKNVIIFVITPTYSRPTQMADMTRLSQTLSLVKDIIWMVIEDSHLRSQ